MWTASGKGTAIRSFHARGTGRHAAAIPRQAYGQAARIGFSFSARVRRGLTLLAAMPIQFSRRRSLSRFSQSILSAALVFLLRSL